MCFTELNNVDDDRRYCNVQLYFASIVNATVPLLLLLLFN